MSEPQAKSEPPVETDEREAPVVILNPIGGRGAARNMLPLIERALRAHRGELRVTRASGETTILAREAAIAGRDVVVVGGDGTVNEAASGMLMAGGRVSLGIVPAGTGNDYAYRAVGLPADPAAALEIALAGEPVSMDVGMVNGRYFLNALGVGIDANIAATAEGLKGYPGMHGQTLYWIASLTELLFHYGRCPQLTVTYDGEPAPSRAFALADISIGPAYGGGFLINPDADPRDGWLDVCTIWKPSQLRALRLLPMVERGKHITQPEVSRRRVRHIILEANDVINAHLDGEIMRDRRFEARILPAALRVRQRPATDGPAIARQSTG